MPSAKDVTVETEFLKLMSVAEPGTGKSIFAASFPTPGFVFDFASSIISYKGLDFDYEQYELSPKGWIKFEKDLMEIVKAVKEGKYLSVIVDDLSSMTTICMERALQINPQRSDTNGPVWNIHYSMVRNLMEGRLHQMMAMACNIDFIAHLNVLTDQKTGNIIGVEPLLVGALPTIIPGYFDEVYYHTTKREGGETHWYIQTVPIGYNRARSRLSGVARTLPDLIDVTVKSTEPPCGYRIVMDYLTGKKTKVKKTEQTPTQTKG